MSIKGVGVDMESVERFRSKNYRRNLAFYEKIFTSREMKACSGKAEPYQCFASRFCAKEAVVKALNRKVGDLKKIEILNEESGQPVVRLKNTRAKIMISMSHTKDYALAVAIAMDQ